MAIPFSAIYSKSIALFDDPKIVTAYETNPVQFEKIMYTYLQNAISMFTNPVSIGVRLSNYEEPVGKLETYEADGVTSTFTIDSSIDLTKSNVSYLFTEDQEYVTATIDTVNRTVTFPTVLAVGKEYSLEQYYCGEFLDDFSNFHSYTTNGDKLIVGEIKDILARLLVKAWAEEERNNLLDIRNLMQDSDFKATGNDRILKTKNAWIDQLDNEILHLCNKLSWNIRFMSGSQRIGRG